MPTLIFPSASQFPMPNGAYYRNAAGEIVLQCTRAELEAAMFVADAIGSGATRPGPAATELDRILRSYAAHGDPWVIRR